MIMNRILAMLVVLGLCCATVLQAGTYVVDSRHPSSADTNPGTREAPLKTISAAAARAVAGDEVLVRPGVYREAVTLTNSGTPGKPIVFRSEEPRQAVISGSDVLTHLQGEGPGIWSSRVPKQNDFGDAMLGGNPQWVYLDGVPLERAETRDRLIPGTFYQDTKDSKDGWRVYVALPEGRDIKGATLEYACRDGLISPQGDQGSELPLNDIHIIGFTVIHNADWYRGKPSIRVTGQRWLVEGNHVLWASYMGGILMRRSNQAVVRSNLVEWIGCQGLGGGLNVDLLVEGNTVRYNNWRMFNWGNEGGGSKWSQNIDACYRGNEFAFNFGPGLWNDGMNAGTIYEKNICHDNTVRSLFSEINWDEVIQDNIVYNTGEGGLCNSQSPGLVIRRNVVFNNGYGISLAGNYTRPNEHEQKWWRTCVTNMAKVPGIAPHRVTLWEAGFLKYFVAPKACMINNCVVWDNILFDNCRGMMENRDYRTNAPMDAFVNNFSDYNIFWASSEKTLFNISYAYQYDGLAAWQKLSGRDEHSVVADPRDPKTKLPAWAEACRKDWDLKMRSITEVDGIRDDGVKQELYRSPMAQIAMGRMLRSPYLKAVQFADKRVKGALFEVEGQRTLALWTSLTAERRYVRLKLGVPKITVESGYLAKDDQDLPGGNVDVLVTYNPTYLRGIGETFSESPSGVLQAQVFNLADHPVPASVTFVNERSEPVLLNAAFSPSAGFSVQPASVNQQLAAGATCAIPLMLKPDGKFRRGTGMLRMEAALGRESIRRVAVFTVGEGDNKLPQAPGPITIDGQLDDWGTVVKDRVPLATINDAGQVLAGPKDGWKGPADLSARYHAVWTTQALYLAVAVEDDKVITSSGAKTEWGSVDVSKGDAVEISLDGRAPDMQWQKELNKGCFDVTVCPAEAGKPPAARLNWRTWQTNVVSATSLTPTGYIVETMIPLTLAHYPAGQWEPGRPVKLSLMIFDADDPAAGAQRQVVGWSVSPAQKNEEDTSGWATVILVK
jgi:hypothetical protein